MEPYGHIKIDNFYPSLTGGRSPSTPDSMIFVLTHMHEDHLVGLSERNYKPNLNWDYGQIYCSTLTQRICLLRFPHLEKYLVPLDLGKEYEIDEISAG